MIRRYGIPSETIGKGNILETFFCLIRLLETYLGFPLRCHGCVKFQKLISKSSWSTFVIELCYLRFEAIGFAKACQCTGARADPTPTSGLPAAGDGCHKLRPKRASSAVALSPGSSVDRRDMKTESGYRRYDAPGAGEFKADIKPICTIIK